MQMLCGGVAALSVATIFYCWRAYAQRLLQRNRVQRERVTYLLWVMAQQVP